MGKEYTTEYVTVVWQKNINADPQILDTSRRFEILAHITWCNLTASLASAGAKVKAC